MKKILGTMNLPSNALEIEKWLTKAAELGYNWLDSASIYGGQGLNETILGPILRKLASQGVTFKLQSKIWIDDFTHLRGAFDKQLASLFISKIDVMLLHRPSINFNETILAWQELIVLQQQGFIDTIGVSNFDKDMINLLVKATGVKPMINQIEHSVSNWRADRLAYCHKQGIEVQGYSPLGKEAAKLTKHPVVKQIAKTHEVSPAVILLSFANAHDVIPIIGTTKVKNLTENAKLVKLTVKETEALNALNEFNNKFEETFSY